MGIFGWLFDEYNGYEQEQQKPTSRYHYHEKFLVNSQLRTYHVYIRLYFNEEGAELFELLLFDRQTRSRFGNVLWSDDPDVIKHVTDEPFTNEHKPLEVAREAIKQHELKEKLSASIRRANGVYSVEPGEYFKPDKKIDVYDNGEHQGWAFPEKKKKAK